MHCPFAVPSLRRLRPAPIVVRSVLFILAASALTLSARADSPNPPAMAKENAEDSSSLQVSARVEGAVVKIFAKSRRPDFGRPWSKLPPQEVTGSGVVIDGHRILTNAHVVAYAGQLQVQANREGDKYSARVAAVSQGMDLAVLTLDDETFFDRHAPLERSATLPQIKDSVLAYGFPVGGTSLSITKGIVSRVEFTAYNLDTPGLRVQIDAAINPGNSGGPATVGDRMIGLAFSTLGGAQNIGYIIPNEEIELFLHGVAAGKPEGKPMLLDELQTLENPALRVFLKLDPSAHGIVVHRPFRSDPGYPLREWDVITSIAGTPVDDEGMTLVGGDLRLDFHYQIQHAIHDGQIALGVIRGGKTVPVKVPLVVERPMLVKSLAGGYPSYFIYGPLVFSRATHEMMASNQMSLRRLDVASGPLITRLFDAPTPQREELVVIAAPLFPHVLSKGYGNAVNAVVREINDVPIRSLSHLVTLLRDLKDEFVVVTIDSRRDAEDMVFRRSEMVAATEDILTDNGVRAQGSPDMMAVWQGHENSH